MTHFHGYTAKFFDSKIKGPYYKTSLLQFKKIHKKPITKHSFSYNTFKPLNLFSFSRTEHLL